MDLKLIRADLKERLSSSRYIHSLGVSEMAKRLAEKYGADPEKAELAGLVHDCAKDMSLEDMQKVAEEGHFAIDPHMHDSKAILHGPAGAVLAKKIYGIKDEDVLSAIYYHTTGAANMTVLQKIIFLADYIEPSRDFPGVDKIRKAAEKSLYKGMITAYKSTISHLLDQKAYIYPLTLEGWNYLVLHSEDEK